MLDKLLDYFMTRLGFRRKRTIHETEEKEEVEVCEPSSKQRKIENPEEHFITSEEFICPTPKWKSAPKKRAMASCRKKELATITSHQSSFQPGSSSLEESKENVIEVSDDEDANVLGVWQDANTLRKRPLYKDNSKRTQQPLASPSPIMNDTNGEDDGDDIQVIKTVSSLREEASALGHAVFQTPSTRIGTLHRHLTLESSNSRKTPVLLQRLRSSDSKYSITRNSIPSSSSFQSSLGEHSKSRLALNESFRLEEKMKYSELLRKFTNVPVQTEDILKLRLSSRSTRSIHDDLQFSNLSVTSRRKANKDAPVVIDLTQPQHKSTTSSKHIEVKRNREFEPSTSSSMKRDESSLKLEPHYTESNSLAELLKSNYFCSENFLPSVNEKYKKKQEARQRQEKEELIKASHFQKKEKKLNDIAALERLEQYLKITDVIQEEAEIVEEEAKLPELTPDMQDVINKALIPKPADEVLVDKFGLPIRRRDMQTLAGLNWLNDEVINFYMELLKERGKLENYPSVYSFNTFFYPRLLSGGHSALKRWTRKVDIFVHDLIIVPVHLGVHWCMATIDFHDKTVKYYDSMGSPNDKCLKQLMQYLKDESQDKKKKPFDDNDWKLINVQGIPQQMNGSDCGMFSCMYAEFICRKARITFTQQDMPYFRRKMTYEIFTKKLLL